MNNVNILVVYASTEGQTRRIAERIAIQVREAGHQAELRNCIDWQSNIDVDSSDRVIVAGSVHEKRHQRPLEMFVMANLAHLQAKPNLFLSVSLSAAFEDGKAEAQSYADAFFDYTGWTPAQTLLVAGALRYEEYDYFMEQIVDHVVLKDRDVAGQNGEREFTDWDAVSRTVDAFLAS